MAINDNPIVLILFRVSTAFNAQTRVKGTGHGKVGEYRIFWSSCFIASLLESISVQVQILSSSRAISRSGSRASRCLARIGGL